MAQSPGHSAIPPPDKSFANALARVNIASQSTLLKRDGPSYVSLQSMFIIAFVGTSGDRSGLVAYVGHRRSA